MDPQNRSHPIDREVTRLAEAQHGVLSRGQLSALGLSKTMIRARLRRGTLVPLHRGVYAVGHRRLHQRGFWMAATLAAGPRAVLSHRDAAALHGLRAPSNAAKTEVTAPTDVRSTPKLRIYARRVLDAADVTVLDAVPTTTVERTLVDLADVIPRRSLAAAVSAAERLRIVDAGKLAAALTRVHGRRGPGQARLRMVVAAHARHGSQLTRSELEQRFLALVAEAGLPAPAMNAHIEGREVDAVWHAERVVVELDGYAFHSDRVAFVEDRRKTNHLQLAGWQPLRYTHHDVLHDRARIVRELRAALAGGA